MSESFNQSPSRGPRKSTNIYLMDLVQQDGEEPMSPSKFASPTRKHEHL